MADRDTRLYAGWIRLLVWFGVVLFAVCFWLAAYGIIAGDIALGATRHHAHRHTGCLDRHRGYSVREVKCITRFVFGSRARAGLNVERCESNFDARETNPSSGAAGPWQVIWRYHPDAPNPYRVGAITRWVWKITRHAVDWTPWVCKP